MTLPSPVRPARPADPSHTVTIIELPGGIRVRVEVPVDQTDTTPKEALANLEASR